MSMLLSVGALLGLLTNGITADQATGAVAVQKLGTIRVTHAVAYAVRDPRNARDTVMEVLLSDVSIDATRVRTALNPHMDAINADELKARNYVLLWIRPDGSVSMNATFSKTMTQFLNDSSDGLRVSWTTNSPTRLDGRVFSTSALKTMDGTSYTVDLQFGVDVPAAENGTALGAGGGEAGRALLALLTAAERKDWTTIRALCGPRAVQMFDKTYNSPQENAADAADLLHAWLPARPAVSGGQLHGDAAILEVEGELFSGQPGLSLVRMIKLQDGGWLFDEAARAGMLRVPR
jgi:hypothetical protein